MALSLQLHREHATTRKFRPHKSNYSSYTLHTLNTRIYRNLKHTDPQRRISRTERPALLHTNIHTPAYTREQDTQKRTRRSSTHTGGSITYSCSTHTYIWIITKNPRKNTNIPRKIPLDIFTACIYINIYTFYVFLQSYKLSISYLTTSIRTFF
jgi:hypothetical protein